MFYSKKRQAFADSISVNLKGYRYMHTRVLYALCKRGGFTFQATKRTGTRLHAGCSGALLGNVLPVLPVEWLTSCYRVYETRQFTRMVGLEPKTTAVLSTESNGMAESFVKTMKRDYISIMPKPDALTAV